jgi:1-deoxy-D-xylulose-5-phosphate reductoisomerase
MTATKRIILLGSTGSIGTSAIDVIAHLQSTSHPGIEVTGLAAGRDWERLADQARRLGVTDLAIADTEAAASLRAACPHATIRSGPHAAEELVRALATETDLVLGAIVGAAGIGASLATVELGIDLALANKESLVAAGALVIPAARDSGARVLPVDSEHSAIWQALQAGTWPDACPGQCPPCGVRNHIARIILTASGGPLREATAAEIQDATVERVLSHPTWDMGAKVTVDSASLTNKALEIIEAHWLFGLGGDQIDVVVHPQSIVHSFVEYEDGSLIAQLGAPDMKTPIQYAITFPDRPAGIAERLDLHALQSLDFAPPDAKRFPALEVAYEVVRASGTTMGAIFNAANEVAVNAFLRGQIPFGRITAVTRDAVSSITPRPIGELDDILDADAEARAFVRERLDSP